MIGDVQCGPRYLYCGTIPKLLYIGPSLLHLSRGHHKNEMRHLTITVTRLEASIIENALRSYCKGPIPLGLGQHAITASENILAKIATAREDQKEQAHLYKSIRRAHKASNS